MGQVISKLAVIPDVPAYPGAVKLLRVAADDTLTWEDVPAAGVSDHGGLTGLGDDDHAQYLLADGSRALAGAWSMGGQTLTNVAADDLTNVIHSVATDVAVRNVNGATLTRGTPVYLSGWNAGQSMVEVAKADSDGAGTMPAIGLVEDDILNNTNGQIVSLGLVQNFDTNAWAVGDALYVSTTAGVLTNTRPTGATEEVQRIATVVRSHLTLGIVQVHGVGRSNAVNNLHTHQSTGAAGGQLDHGLALTGLGDDDHTQYLLVDGTRAMTGTLLLSDGAVGAPSLAFASDVGFGFTLTDSQTKLRVVDNGATIAYFSGGGVAIVPTTTLSAGANLSLAGGELLVTGDNTANVPLTVDTPAGHATNIAEFQVNGTPLATISQAGLGAFTGATVTGITKLGDGGTTDYSQFAADGELTLAGTARVKLDIQFDPTHVKLGGINDPATAVVGVTPVLSFDKNADEEIFLAAEIPHGYADGTDLDVHIHWAPADGNAGDVTWGIEYLIVRAENNEVLTGGTTTAIIVDATQSLQDEHLISGSITISGAGVLNGDYMHARMFRDANASEVGASDTYANDAHLISMDIEYTMNKLGEAT